MPEHLYRFRTANRLIGNDTTPGELIQQHIYFASPEQLNDPMEGHREIYWPGDKVVWSNLFKHYITCLAIRSFQFLIDPDLSSCEFPINTHSSTIPDELGSHLTRATSQFVQNINIQNHIATLSNNEKMVYRGELGVHLKSIQVYALSLITKMLIDLGMTVKNNKLASLTDDELLQSSTDLLATYSDSSPFSTGEDNFIFDTAVYAVWANQFGRGYSKYKTGANDYWSKLAVDFTEDFISSLSQLSSEKWYTACFMESCSNSSIWGSYGDNHKGICLKFKTSKNSDSMSLSFHKPIGTGPKGLIWEQSPLQFKKVNYERTPPKLDFFRTLGIYSVSNLYKYWYKDDFGTLSVCADVLENQQEWRRLYWERHYESLTSKMPDWNTENEYRLILESGLSHFEENENRCLKYDFSALDGIIFGINTPTSEKYKIVEIAENLCEIHHRSSLELYQAYYDKKTNTIKYRPLISLSCTTELNKGNIN